MEECVTPHWFIDIHSVPAGGNMGVHASYLPRFEYDRPAPVFVKVKLPTTVKGQTPNVDTRRRSENIERKYRDL